MTSPTLKKKAVTAANAVDVFWTRQVHRCPPTPASDTAAQLSDDDLTDYLIKHVTLARGPTVTIKRPVRFVGWPKRVLPAHFLVCGSVSDPDGHVFSDYDHDLTDPLLIDAARHERVTLQ